MPRKSTRKDTATVTKQEEVTPRRSGRASTSTKQETSTSAGGKSASRSRRGSTAAQTAASVADSKIPKNRNTSSPADSRNKSGRENSESPATRVKSTRRSTGRINYKESDGEEEAAAPKYDKNFESGDEFESESDEKSKPKEKSTPTKATRGSGSKEKPERVTRGRKGRPSKKKPDVNKTVDISDDSMEPEIIETKAKEPETKKSTRGRKPKSEVVDVELENTTKTSRKSGRASTSKEESPKKRPSRSVKAKRYAEDEEDEIEEILVTKETEEETKQTTENNRKRKLDSPTQEPSKRLKESEDVECENDEKVKEDNVEMEQTQSENKETVPEESAEEPMEVEGAESADAPEANLSDTPKEVEDIKSKDDEGGEKENISETNELSKSEASDSVEEPLKDSEVIDEKQDLISESKEEEKVDSKPQEQAQSCDQEMDSEPSGAASITDPVEEESKPEPAFPSDDKSSPSLEKTDNSKEVKEETMQIEESSVDETLNQSSVEHKIEDNQSKDSVEIDTKEKEQPVQAELNSEMDKEKSPLENDNVNSIEMSKNDTNDIKTNEQVMSSDTFNQTENSTINETQDKSNVSDLALNGAEKLSNSVDYAIITHTSNCNNEIQTSDLKANGTHEDNHSEELNHSFFSLPGRKYVFNPKINETDIQSIKNKAFGFLSYNLGSDSLGVQKEKLLKELDELRCQIICLQQVPKPFYTAVLEPSLDALGYKSIFSQPADCLKGMATFYKSSQFRLDHHFDISLRQLIDKELEVSLLEPTSKAAIKSFIKRCGNALLTHFKTVMDNKDVVVANVQIPTTDIGIHALQVSCLAREIIRINGDTSKPLLVAGEFNITQNEASYQLLRDGYLANDMIDELQKRKDIAVPEKENSSLVDLLWKSFQHPSSSLCSCYSSVLNRELVIPEFKKASPDLLWYSSDSLMTVGVVDAVSEELHDRHLSLKADIAFCN